MSSKNLWGQLPSTDEITTPTQILKEQATQLTDLTKGVLQGDVSVRQSSGKFLLQLAIQAPFVDNYEYVALYASHSLDLYPVTVAAGWEDKYHPKTKVDCANREEFETTIGGILSSDRIRRVIASLLAQSRAM